jgi:hypothetical protein
MKAARPHDDAMVELLREDPAFADEYLAAALEEADEPGGRQACCAPCAMSPKRKAWRKLRNAPACAVKAFTARCLPRGTRRLKRCWRSSPPPVCAWQLPAGKEHPA